MIFPEPQVGSDLLHHHSVNIHIATLRHPGDVARFPLLAHVRWSEPGRARQLCPGISDVDFLRDLDRVVDLDAEVANRALDLGVAKRS